MNKGIEILLERMKSNPEEIGSKEGRFDKWTTLVREYEGVLSEEDQRAFFEARKQLLQDQFTAEVMKELLDPKSESPYTVRGSVMHSGGVTLSPYSNTTATATINANSLTLGTQTLDEETIKHMKAHLDYIRKENIAKEKKVSLMEKLFKLQIKEAKEKATKR